MVTIEDFEHQGISDLESKIGVKSGFFKELLNEDDWSFVIKLHALFEAVATHLLLFHFKEPELSDLIGRLELSNKTTGKIAFLDKLELISNHNRRFISSLSELRNSLVHDVRNSEFALDEFVANLTKAEVKRFVIAFRPYEALTREFASEPKLKNGIDPELIRQADIGRLATHAKEDPKEFIWIGSISTLASLADMYSYSDYKQWIKARRLFGNETDDY